jgi:2,3-bisphosphoglycerate-independent phosphoglycerate mutase
LIYVTQRPNASVKSGILADVAPSICQILDIPQPKEMTGKKLLKI